MENIGVSFAEILPSFNPIDLLVGVALAGIMKFVLYIKAKNKKKFRQGEEYGSAVWGTQKDIEPYMDLNNFENNVILTWSEFLTMGKPSIAGDGAEAIGKGNGSGSSGALKDSAGNDISLKEIALYGASDKTSVTNIVIDGSKEVVTIGDKLYLYLPVGTKPTSVTAGGYTYVCYSNGQMYKNHSD